LYQEQNAAAVGPAGDSGRASRGPAHGDGATARGTRKIQKRRATVVPETADRRERVVKAGQVAVPGPKDGRRVGGFAGGFGEGFSASAGASQGSRSNRAAARAVHGGADDRAIAWADYCQCGKQREPDSIF